MALLDEVKNYLDITWSDDAGDLKISGIISRGQKYLNSMTGVTLDYTTDDKPKGIIA